MLQKWKDRALQMNSSKEIKRYIICTLTMVIGLGVLWYINTHGTMDLETIKHAANHEDLSTMNIVSTVITEIAVIFFGIWYWMICLMWVYKRTHILGIQNGMWIWAAVFLNFLAMIALYGYETVKGSCPGCGKLISHHEKYCERCGDTLMKNCLQCISEVSINANYCSSCGKSLQEDKEAYNN